MLVEATGACKQDVNGLSVCTCTHIHTVHPYIHNVHACMVLYNVHVHVLILGTSNDRGIPFERWLVIIGLLCVYKPTF